MAQNCANITRIYDIKIKAEKRTHQGQLHNKNAERSARLTVLLKAVSCPTNPQIAVMELEGSCAVNNPLLL